MDCGESSSLGSVDIGDTSTLSRLGFDGCILGFDTCYVWKLGACVDAITE